MKEVQSITLRPIVLNSIGEGQPEAPDRLANNTFLDTCGLSAPANAEQGAYILQRVAELSRPFGTRVDVNGDRATGSVTSGK